MNKDQNMKMETICRRLVDHFYTSDTTVKEMQEWMKSPQNCVHLICRIQDLNTLLNQK